MSRPVTLVAWEDATKNPPEAGRVVLTDEGMARSWSSGRVWEFDVPDMEGPCNPSVWCDPSPPGPDALTVEDLAAIVQHAEDTLEQVKHLRDEGYVAKFRKQVARLRAALDALGNGGT